MIRHEFVKDAYQLPDSWDGIAEDDIFLKRSFLKALQVSSPSNITSYYLMFFKEELLIGVCVVQRVQIYYKDIFRPTEDRILLRLVKQLISKVIKGNALVVGNLMHTGQHAFKIRSEQVDFIVFLEVLNSALRELQQIIKKEFNKNIRIIGFKDFFEDDPIHEQTVFFQRNNFYRVRVQPNLIFEIPESWCATQNYILGLNKKYKRRYKTALNKKSTIEVKELNVDAIKHNEKQLYHLYENVSDNARVNSFKLAPNHFFKLKENLQHHFKLFAYYLGEELVGFYTLIENNKSLETYFLGYNSNLQKPYQLYLNMLYDMAMYAIDNQFERVIFARTAMEIKSSVGAKPKNMSIYLHHTGGLFVNPMLKFIVKYMNPIQKWEQRHPFSK